MYMHTKYCHENTEVFLFLIFDNGVLSRVMAFACLKAIPHQYRSGKVASHTPEERVSDRAGDECPVDADAYVSWDCAHADENGVAVRPSTWDCGFRCGTTVPWQATGWLVNSWLAEDISRWSSSFSSTSGGAISVRMQVLVM